MGKENSTEKVSGFILNNSNYAVRDNEAIRRIKINNQEWFVNHEGMVDIRLDFNEEYIKNYNLTKIEIKNYDEFNNINIKDDKTIYCVSTIENEENKILFYLGDKLIKNFEIENENINFDSNKFNFDIHNFDDYTSKKFIAFNDFIAKTTFDASIPKGTATFTIGNDTITITTDSYTINNILQSNFPFSFNIYNSEKYNLREKYIIIKYENINTYYIKYPIKVFNDTENTYIYFKNGDIYYIADNDTIENKNNFVRKLYDPSQE